jgi:hypothetical protein
MKKRLFLFCTVIFFSVANIFGQSGKVEIQSTMVQKKIAAHEKLNKLNIKHYDFEISKLPITIKTKIESDCWQPDTVYVFDENYEYTQRETYSYNVHGMSILQLIDEWQDNLWKNVEKNTYEYDDNNNLLTEFCEFWFFDAWRFMKFTNFYDASNNLLTCIGEFCWENNIWENTYRRTYTYDVNNNELTNLYQQWANNTWINGNKHTYTYDSNNNNLTDLYEERVWPDDTLIIKDKYTYTYDANSNLVTSLHETFWENTWFNSTKGTYTYDSNNNKLTDLYENWNWENSTWNNSIKYTYTYDSNNNLLISLQEYWDNDMWFNSTKVTYTYDFNNNLLNYLSESWENDTWGNLLQSFRTYDNNNNTIDADAWRWQENSWVAGLSLFYLYYNNMQNSIFIGSGHKVNVCYKNTNPNTIEKVEPIQITVYPNPIAGELKIKCGELKIKKVDFFDVYGRKLQISLGSFISPENVINISHLPAGTYFVKILTESGEVTKKVLKE